MESIYVQSNRDIMCVYSALLVHSKFFHCSVDVCMCRGVRLSVSSLVPRQKGSGYIGHFGLSYDVDVWNVGCPITVKVEE